MAVGIYVRPSSMTSQQYDECIRKLAAVGAAAPAGRLYHACFGEGTTMAVFDVWDSRESFERFGATLGPILSEIGIDMGTPHVMPVHNVILPSSAGV